MDLFLDGNGPLYRQLARALRNAIVGGRLPDGTRLPASRDLAHDLGLSRTTVVAAYEELRTEGLLSGKVGSGSYVSFSRQPLTRALPTVGATLPQSAYSRRGRQVHGAKDFPGHRKPGMRYAFQYGFPMINGRLASAWAREVSRAAPYVRPNYPSPQGLPALREAICAHVTRTRGVVCEADDILIVNGAQQALSLIARVLVDPGDDVVMEEPHYFGARKLLQIHGAQLIGVDVDADGLKVDALPNRPPKLVCVTPSHQFPTGVVLSLPRRLALLDYAKQCGGWIAEDDYDGEFRRDSNAVAALQSIDRDGRVVYVGSFSKTLLPASRLGFVVMPRGLREDFLTAKWADDFGTSTLEQTALAQFIASGGYERHLRQVIRKLTERRDLMAQSLRAECGDCDFSETHTGMHLMMHCRGLPAESEAALIRLAEQRKLGVYSARPCYFDPPHHAVFLMGFSAMPAREIRDAVKLFAGCLREVREQVARTQRHGLKLAYSR